MSWTDEERARRALAGDEVGIEVDEGGAEGGGGEVGLEHDVRIAGEDGLRGARVVYVAQWSRGRDGIGRAVSAADIIGWEGEQRPAHHGVAWGDTGGAEGGGEAERAVVEGGVGEGCGVGRVAVDDGQLLRVRDGRLRTAAGGASSSSGAGGSTHRSRRAGRIACRRDMGALRRVCPP